MFIYVFVFLKDLAEHVITCQKVIDEVRNKRQLKRLAVLPYDLEVKDVFPENIKFGKNSIIIIILFPLRHCMLPWYLLVSNACPSVHDISKQTGDYRSLSATDIEVIALTYQLEKEKVGTEHLKTKVEMQKSVCPIDHCTVDVKDIAGFYLPSKKVSVLKMICYIFFYC